jgi:preprotein translocase subunit SecG
MLMRAPGGGGTGPTPTTPPKSNNFGGVTNAGLGAGVLVGQRHSTMALSKVWEILAAIVVILLVVVVVLHRKATK